MSPKYFLAILTICSLASILTSTICYTWIQFTIIAMVKFQDPTELQHIHFATLFATILSFPFYQLASRTSAAGHDCTQLTRSWSSRLIQPSQERNSLSIKGLSLSYSQYNHSTKLLEISLDILLATFSLLGFSNETCFLIDREMSECFLRLGCCARSGELILKLMWENLN